MHTLPRLHCRAPTAARLAAVPCCRAWAQDIASSSKEATQLRQQLEGLESTNKLTAARLEEAQRSNSQLHSIVRTPTHHSPGAYVGGGTFSSMQPVRPLGACIGLRFACAQTAQPH